MTRPFEGKLCVVTGAGSGIGRAVAMELARRGASLALSDIDEAGLEETRSLIGEASNRMRYDRLDVADADAIKAYADSVRESLGPADYVFNIAGLSRIGNFDDTPLSSFEKVIDVNFLGVVRMTKAFLPQLIETKGGLINIASIFGVIGVPGQTHYCASKFAVRGFSESLSQELETRGVRVTSVQPGGVKTNIVRKAAIDAPTPGFENTEAAARRFDKAAKTTPARAAEIILDGAAKGKRRVMVGGDAKLLSFVQRLFPRSYMRLLSSLRPKENA